MALNLPIRLALATVLLMGFAPDAPAETPAAKLAIVTSLTGPGGFYGVPARDGATLAAEEANADAAAPRVALSVDDDQSKPDMAADLARKIAAGDAIAVVGPSLTITAMSTGPAFEDAGLPAITPTAHGDAVVNADSTFQPLFNGGEMGTALANYLYHVLDGRRAVVIYRDDAFGGAIAVGFRRAAARLRLDTSYRAFSTPAERDEAARTIASDATRPAVIIAALQGDAVPLLLAMRRAGAQGPFLGSSALAGDEFARLFAAEPEETRIPGYFTNDLYATSPVMFDSGDSPTVQFAKKFRDRFGRDPGWSAAQGYDAARLAIDAIRHAVTTQGRDASAKALRTAARDRLLALDGPAQAIQGATGPLWFLPTRGRAQAVRIGRFQDRLFESAPIQLVTVRSYDESEFASGAVIDLGDGRVARRQRVVYAGTLLNEISNIDVARSRFTADLYVWFRYPDAQERKLADPDDIEFPDLVGGGSPRKQAARKVVLDDGSRYRLWRVRGVFRNEFDLRRFPVDQQTLGLRFFNARAASDGIVYALDRRSSDAATATGGEAFRQLTQWEPLRVVSERASLVTRSGLGNPLLVGLEQSRELSGFRVNVEIRRDVVTTVLKSLLPLALMMLIVYSTLFFPARLIKEKVTVTVTGALSAAVLLSAINGQSGNPGYIMAVEYLFYVFFCLCLFCFVSFVVMEQFRVGARQRLVGALEFWSRVAYLAVLVITLGGAMVIGGRWYQ